ncbi:hypothetical protein [Kitasatospora sp. NPDC048538]|uniref:hypothetical protein n=1 Tax=unclassified Kitasatospora TaxID=2633591 RepID=UPI0033C3B072
MLTHSANGDPRLALWRRVREYAVPPTMIETATTRRLAGDWAGACAAAGVDVDIRLRDVARGHGRELADRLREDLHRLAPDLLRWHLPRTAPDGLLRPGLTMALARYRSDRPVFLVVRTPPAWADYEQRISLALTDGPAPDAHPHPRPGRRFRLDLHRHLWDAERGPELRLRAGDGGPKDDAPTAPTGLRCAVDRWAVEARLLLRADGLASGPVVVRLGRRHRLLLDPETDALAPVPDGLDVHRLPVLPDPAVWVPPDLDLLRAGAIEADRLHPLVAAALTPGGPHHRPIGPSGPVGPVGPDEPWLVECRGARHRIGVVDGRLTPLDHDPAQLRREELLAALSGTALPCLRAVHRAHRAPHDLDEVRERLRHGDTAGALAVVEALLGPDAALPTGALRDELEAAAERRTAYRLYRAGLDGPAPDGPRRAHHASAPRHSRSRTRTRAAAR